MTCFLSLPTKHHVYSKQQKMPKKELVIYFPFTQIVFLLLKACVGEII